MEPEFRSTLPFPTLPPRRAMRGGQQEKGASARRRPAIEKKKRAREERPAGNGSVNSIQTGSDDPYFLHFSFFLNHI
jgi:hypothetical protein